MFNIKKIGNFLIYSKAMVIDEEEKKIYFKRC